MVQRVAQKHFWHCHPKRYVKKIMIRSYLIHNYLVLFIGNDITKIVLWNDWKRRSLSEDEDGLSLISISALLTCILFITGTSLILPAASTPFFRTAKKKASGGTGGNKNQKQAHGKGKGIRRWDGTHVFPGDILVFRQSLSRMWFHPGANVCLPILSYFSNSPKKNEKQKMLQKCTFKLKQKYLCGQLFLQVCMTRRRMNLVALKEGIVRVSCEKPDLNFNQGFVKMFYSGREGHTFFKKYYHVIPFPQHTRFRCIDQI